MARIISPPPRGKSFLNIKKYGYPPLFEFTPLLTVNHDRFYTETLQGAIVHFPVII